MLRISPLSISNSPLIRAFLRILLTFIYFSSIYLVPPVDLKNTSKKPSRYPCFCADFIPPFLSIQNGYIIWYLLANFNQFNGIIYPIISLKSPKIAEKMEYRWISRDNCPYFNDILGIFNTKRKISYKYSSIFRKLCFIIYLPKLIP